MIFITTENEDRFFLPVREAVQHIRLGESRKVWVDEVNTILNHLHSWVRQQSPRPSSCYATLKGGRIRVFVSPASGRFDCDLADAVSLLNLELIRVSSLVESHVSQVPAETPERNGDFLDVDLAFDLTADPT